MDGNANKVAPKQLLSVGDGIFLTVGMIVGALIFKAPSTVAGATSGTGQFLLAWALGGLVSLVHRSHHELVALRPIPDPHRMELDLPRLPAGDGHHRRAGDGPEPAQP